jgi:hypothetical protein
MTEFNNANDIVLTEYNRRPKVLTVLCFFSMVWSGAVILVSLVGLFFSGFIAETINYLANGTVVLVKVFFYVFSITSLIFSILTFWGALLMYRLKKSGYWLYIIPSIITTISCLFLSMSFFNIFYLLLSIAFIILYSLNRQYLK